MDALDGIPAARIARLLGVHLDTARRYKRSGRMPRAIARYLELRLAGELGFVDTAWRGFRLVAGQLVTPEGATLRPGEIRAVPIRLQQIAELERLAAEPRQWNLALED